MLESLNQPATPAASPPVRARVRSMVANERTAGYIPSYHAPRTARQNVESALSQPGRKAAEFNNALAYNADDIGEIPVTPEEEFTFADLIDMVNPFQHIPVVSHIYREITDDEIKPVSKIIGGAVFGGPAGAASGLVNVVIEEETGQDLVGNALSLTHKKQEPEADFTIRPFPDALPEKEPITTLDIETLQTGSAEEQKAYDDLPAALLAFVDTGALKIETVSRESFYVEAAHGRTAGFIRRYG